ncbi:MAG: hypothetical protein WCN88_04060 [Candidatus Falkowbacteria bacterium]
MVENIENSSPEEGAVAVVKKGANIIESMGCCCLNLGCMLLLLAQIAIIAMIVKVVSNPFEALGALLSSIWSSFAGK